MKNCEGSCKKEFCEKSCKCDSKKCEVAAPKAKKCPVTKIAGKLCPFKKK